MDAVWGMVLMVSVLWLACMGYSLGTLVGHGGFADKVDKAKAAGLGHAA